MYLKCITQITLYYFSNIEPNVSFCFFPLGTYISHCVLYIKFAFKNIFTNFCEASLSHYPHYLITRLLEKC